MISNYGLAKLVRLKEEGRACSTGLEDGCELFRPLVRFRGINGEGESQAMDL